MMPSGSFAPNLVKSFKTFRNFVSTFDTCHYFVKIIITSKIVPASHEQYVMVNIHYMSK